MKKEDIVKKVIDIIEHQMNYAHFDYINDELEFENDLLLDSLDCVEIIINIEKEFQIAINDDEVEYFKKVGELTNYIVNILSKGDS